MTTSPYEGTTIGSDGKRYANDDGNIPTTPQKRGGKAVTLGTIDSVVGEVLPAINGILTVTRTTTSGNVTPTFDGVAGSSMSAPTEATTASAFKSALVASLPNVATEDFNASGPAGGPFVLEADEDGAWGGQVLPTLSIAGGTGGSVSVAVTEPGRAQVSGVDGLVGTVEGHDEAIEALEEA